MMKCYEKRCAALLVVIALLCALTACQNDTASNIRVLGEPEAQPEYLSFFSNKSMSDSDLTKYWIEQFTKQYNRQVYVNFDGATYYADEGLSYRELLEKRLGSSAPDDMYIINAEDVLEFENKGYWMDLSDMDFVDSLSESALYQSTYNGKVFSLPLSFTGFGLAWNVDLLAQHNLHVPQNLDEFLNVCETLKAAGILPYGANKGFSLTVPAMCVGFAELYRSENRDAEIASLNSGETPVSNYMRKGFEFLSMMIENGYMDPQQALESTPRAEDYELLLAGGCAFICAGLGVSNELNDLSFQIAATGLPVLESGSVAVYGANSRLCVNPNSKHIDMVRQFIEMVGTPEALAKSAELENAISSAKGGDTNRLPFEHELVTLIQQPNQVPNQDFALHFNTWESIRDVCREICRGISVDQACALLDEKQREDLKVYGINKS